MDKYLGYSTPREVFMLGGFIITITLIVMIYGRIKRYCTNKKPKYPKWHDKL